MSNESPAPAAAQPASPTVTLFQKAHAKMVTLSRLDEQLQALLDQRKRLQDELRGVQSAINDEFNRVTADAQSGPPKLVAQVMVENVVAVPAKRNGNANKQVNRIEAAV